MSNKDNNIVDMNDLSKRFEDRIPSCKEMVDLLNLYVDGELDEKTRAAFDKHFELCPPCVDFLANYKKAIDLGKVAARKESAEELPCSVKEHLRSFLIKHGIPLKKNDD